VQGRCPDGSKIQRRFHKESTRVRDLENWYRREKMIGPGSPVTVSTSFPKKTLDNPDLTLVELKFGKQEVLIFT